MHSIYTQSVSFGHWPCTSENVDRLYVKRLLFTLTQFQLYRAIKQSSNPSWCFTCKHWMKNCSYAARDGIFNNSLNTFIIVSTNTLRQLTRTTCYTSKTKTTSGGLWNSFPNYRSHDLIRSSTLKWTKKTVGKQGGYMRTADVVVLTNKNEVVYGNDQNNQNPRKGSIKRRRHFA